jgi:hypothetical protein
MKKENWPPKLLREWEIFEGLARQGVGPEHELAVEAKKLGFSIDPLSPVSIDDYEAGMSRALGVIPRDDTLGILDLITVVRKPGVEDRDLLKDDGIPKTHNARVDIFRVSEQVKPGKVKGVGYDSVSFQHFIQAIKAVAVRNGYGRYVKAFRQAYRTHRDELATERRKAEKKEGLSLAWVDQEIVYLTPQFNRIVRSGSFKRKEGRVKQADRDMFLVLFFVWLVTMRYMGYRQGSLVACEIGKNFILNSDGSITLKFDKTKNNKRLYMELNESRRDSHGLLWDTLSLYYLKVYPYMVRRSGNTLNGRLFVTTDGWDGSFRRFKDFSDFDESFYSGRDRFLRVDDLSAKMRDKLNPHFLRGLCADWMITVLHMTYDEAGEVLGDDPAMLKKRYINRNRVHDAGAAFDAANARNRLVRESAANASKLDEAIKRIEKTVNAQVKQKDEELAAVRRELEAERAGHAATKLALQVLRETLGHQLGQPTGP